MNETFFGPWTVDVVAFWTSWGTRVVFSGTTAHDGAHKIDPPTEFAVDGTQWTLAVETNSADFQDNWTPQPLRRGTRFDQVRGLIVDVEMGIPHPGGLVPEWDYVHLVCVSADSSVNPDPMPNPFDFTYPRDAHKTVGADVALP